MCTMFSLIKKGVAGVVASGVGIAASKINRGVGVVAGAVTFVAADLGLDYLTSKIELDKIRKESEELAGEDTTHPDEFDFDNDFNYDYSDVAEETVTVETVIKTQELENIETKSEEKPEEKKEVEEKPEEKKEVEEKPLSPLEEDKRRAKELDELEDEGNKSLNSYPASKQPTRKNK